MIATPRMQTRRLWARMCSSKMRIAVAAVSFQTRWMKAFILFVCSLCGFACVSHPADRETRAITVSVQAPDSAWSLAIRKVVEVGEEIWVVAELKRPDGMVGASVITDLEASVKVAAPDLPLKVFVVGKTWNWGGEDGYTYVKSGDELPGELGKGKVLFQRMQDLGL